MSRAHHERNPLLGAGESNIAGRGAGNYAWPTIAMLWLVCFFSYADRQAFFSVFPLMRQGMGLSTVQLGMLGSSFAVVYGIAGPFAGYIVDRVRRKTATLGGLELWSMVCILSAVARNFTQLLLFRAAEGLGEAIFYPAALSMVSDYHGPRSRSRAMGLLQTSVYAGTVGGGYWAGAVAQRHGWRAALFFFGALGCLLGVLLMRLLREPQRGSADTPIDGSGPPSRATVSLRDIGSLLRIRSLVALMGVFAGANFVALVLLTWMPMYLYTRFHLSLAAAAFDAAVYPQIASIAGSIAGGYLADTLVASDARSRVWVQCGGVLAGAPFVVLSGISPSLTGVIVAISCWGFCKGIYDSNIFAAAFDVAPIRTRGSVSGLMNCVGWLIGGGAAPVTIGFLAGRLGMGRAIATSGAVYLGSGILLAVTAVRLLGWDLVASRK
ncbi:MAG: MFS transporter [Acidobacteriaceae bacterium]